MKKDLWSGLFLSAVSLLVLLLLIPHGVVEPKKIKYAALSPSYYPRIVAAVLLALGLVIAVRTLWRNRAQSALSETDNSDVHPNAGVRIVLVFIMLAVFALTVSYLGFVLGAIILLVLTFWLAGERRPGLVLPLSIVLPFALYFFFLKVAAVPIPTGILSNWLAGI